MDVQILKNFAKKLVPLSIENGQVSDSCVKQVLSSVEKTHFSQIQQKRILKYYLFGIKKELKKSRAIVEFAGTLPESSINLIQKKLEKIYNTSISVETKENSSLLAGIKVSIGDDVWDSSIQGQLQEFQQKF